MRNNKTARRDIRSPIVKKHKERMFRHTVTAYRKLSYTPYHRDNPHWLYLLLTSVKIKQDE